VTDPIEFASAPAKKGRSGQGSSLLVRFAVLSVAWMLASWIFAYVCRLRGMMHPYRWPYYYEARGEDFTAFQRRFELFHTVAFFHWYSLSFPYPAPIAIFYKALFAVWGHRAHPIRVFWLFALAVCVVACWMFLQALRRRGVSTLFATGFIVVSVLSSYPLYFVLQRGNVEILLWAFIMATIWAYWHGHMRWAAFFLGIAIALKWYPIILLALFLSRRDYKAIAIALCTAVLTTLLAASLLGPTIPIALRETAKGMSDFVNLYAKTYHMADLGYDHSFFGVFKVVTYRIPKNLPVDINRYFALAAVGGLMLYFLRIRTMPAFNQVAVLLLLSTTLPPVSYDYTLLHLYIPLALFFLYVLDAERCLVAVPHARSILFWFTFSLAPHGYVIYHAHRYCGTFRFVGLMVLLYMFLMYPFPEIANSGTNGRKISEEHRNLLPAT
jgi:hypothetical protein